MRLISVVFIAVLEAFGGSRSIFEPELLGSPSGIFFGSSQLLDVQMEIVEERSFTLEVFFKAEKKMFFYFPKIEFRLDPRTGDITEREALSEKGVMYKAGWLSVRQVGSIRAMLDIVSSKSDVGVDMHGKINFQRHWISFWRDSMHLVPKATRVDWDARMCGSVKSTFVRFEPGVITSSSRPYTIRTDKIKQIAFNTGLIAFTASPAIAFGIVLCVFR